MRCGILVALAGIFLLPAARATDSIFENPYSAVYTIPGNPPPQVDARVFYNHAPFTVNYLTYNSGTAFYETMNTLFYTNTDLMIANSPTLTNGVAFFIFGQQDFAVGFNFDLQTSQHLWADTFYNSGTIRCASVLDGNNLFGIFTIFGSQLLSLNSYGECLVAATNIQNQGTVQVSENGLISFTGKNVDLSQSFLIQDPPLFFSGLFSTVSINSVGAVGVNTNVPWNPFFSLLPTFAQSSYSPFPFNLLTLTNSTAYIQDDPSPFTANTIIHRAVFIQNDSPDVVNNVYFDPVQTFNFGFDTGDTHVEWVASYTDSASGNPISSYLYLTDDFLLGASTNVFIIGGVPDNFQFINSSTPLLFGPATPGFVPEFPDVELSNRYSFFSGALTAATVSTNVSYANPHGTITNLPGQIRIVSSNELNLAFTTISGPNYLRLNCTNQFDGSPGAAIAAPFADIALGVTNGFMTVSNVLMAALPNWNGPVSAWSTTWTNVDTTVDPGITNVYRVMIVYSDLEPTTSPWIKDLYLHGTNVLTISDHLNVYGSFFTDASVLTLNTNTVGAGATSLDGEIFWDNNLVFNANSGSGQQQMPNLLWVTNNGAIRTLNAANFGNVSAPQFAVTPGVPAIAAVGKLSRVGTNAVINDKVTIGTNLYTFVNILTNTRANQIKWASTGDASLSNLVAAINGASGSGTKYSTSTRSNAFVSAGPVVNHAFTVTARSLISAVGDAIPTLFTPATIASNLTWSGLVTLANGVDAIPPFTNYTAFINHGLVADQNLSVWTTFFENDGTMANGSGSFTLHAGVATLTNGSISAGDSVLLIATNRPGMGVNGMVISNVQIQAGHRLTIVSPNLTDTGVTNGNIWTVGATSGGGTVDSGFNVLLKPPVGDLLGTTVTNIAPYNKTVYNVWAGANRGLSTDGYTNNLALGHLILDSLTTNHPSPVAYVFSGAGSNNALYVDCLELKDGAVFGNATNNYNFPWLKINTNMMIYYAQALENGVSVAEAIDNQSKIGANGGRLRWIYSYAGFLSSTNIIYTNMDGSTYTNTVNTALAQSSTIDSDSDGLPNSVDPTPFYAPTELNFTMTMTNLPPPSVRIEWTTIPNATNFIYYTTNLMNPNGWLAFTNFKNFYYGNNVAVTNAAHSNYFRSPQVYINNASLPDNSQQTNVWVYDAITNAPRYYKVVVWPWLNFPE